MSYTTSDIYQAAYLCAKGIEIVSAKEHEYIFNNSHEQASRLAAIHYPDAPVHVNVKAVVEAYQRLKGAV